MHRSYRIREFAALAGVTVKALHHYDRLGLLQPRRTDAGYRVYTDADLERLEQIVALKFIGLPLKQIRVLLDRGAPPLAEALRLQRRALEDRRRQIERAVDAVAAAETAMADGDGLVPVLRRLIEAITVEDDAEVLKPYFGDAAWTEWKARRADTSAREWEELYRDIEAVRAEEVTSPRAQAVADRWLALIEKEVGGDPSVRTGLLKAWVDGHRLPAVLNRGADEAAIARATKFVSDAVWARVGAEQRANTAAVPHQANEPRIALFRDTEALLGTDPGAADARALVARWDELLEREADGDPETIQAMRAALANRARWPDGMRTYVASLYGATPETWERVVHFVERARALCAG